MYKIKDLLKLTPFQTMAVFTQKDCPFLPESSSNSALSWGAQTIFSEPTDIVKHSLASSVWPFRFIWITTNKIIILAKCWERNSSYRLTLQILLLWEFYRWRKLSIEWDIKVNFNTEHKYVVRDRVRSHTQQVYYKFHASTLYLHLTVRLSSILPWNPHLSSLLWPN